MSFNPGLRFRVRSSIDHLRVNLQVNLRVNLQVKIHTLIFYKEYRSIAKQIKALLVQSSNWKDENLITRMSLLVEVVKEVEVFNDLASLTYSVAKLPEGEYRMKTLVMNEGRVIYWTLPLKMTLQNIVGNVYVVKFSGRGKVLDNSIDCTKPFVLTFTLNHNNKQVSSSVLDGGSCPNIHTADQNVVWKTNEKGLKKITDRMPA